MSSAIIKIFKSFFRIDKNEHKRIIYIMIYTRAYAREHYYCITHTYAYKSGLNWFLSGLNAIKKEKHVNII